MGAFGREGTTALQYLICLDEFELHPGHLPGQVMCDVDGWRWWLQAAGMTKQLMQASSRTDLY
jgi:hypothetical protein